MLRRSLRFAYPGAPIPAPGSLGRTLATQSYTPLTKKGGESGIKDDDNSPAKSVASCSPTAPKDPTQERNETDGREREEGRGGRKEE